MSPSVRALHCIIMLRVRPSKRVEDVIARSAVQLRARSHAEPLADEVEHGEHGEDPWLRGASTMT